MSRPFPVPAALRRAVRDPHSCPCALLDKTAEGPDPRVLASASALLGPQERPDGAVMVFCCGCGWLLGRAPAWKGEPDA